jgi:hypothetical protein
MTDALTPGGRLRQYGDRRYSEIRFAKGEEYIAKKHGYEATKQGRALEARYLSQLTDKIEPTSGTAGATMKCGWR